MAETYCGKSCAECVQKEQLNCPGCKEGPGKQIDGDCSLAKCVREKGYETCDGCGSKGFCGTLRSRDHIPNFRIKKIEAEKMRKAAIAKRVLILRKWPLILFLLILLQITGGILMTIGIFNADEATSAILPRFFIPAQLIDIVCPVAYGIILLILASEENSYRTSGICALVAIAAYDIAKMIDSSYEATVWALLLTVLSAIIAQIGECNEYLGHSAVVVDDRLSKKWMTLWKWNFGLSLAVFSSILLTLFVESYSLEYYFRDITWNHGLSLGFFGSILLIEYHSLNYLVGLAAIGAVGLWLVRIVKFFYLCRTAKIFRTYKKSLNSNDFESIPLHRNDNSITPTPGYLVSYPVNGGNIMFDPTVGAVVGFKGEIAEVSIPAEIDGVIVAAIGNSAFRSSSLTSITIPASVTSIGDYAFSGCYKLKDIYYGGSAEQWNQLGKTENDINSAVVHYGAVT